MPKRIHSACPQEVADRVVADLGDDVPWAEGEITPIAAAIEELQGGAVEAIEGLQREGWTQERSAPGSHDALRVLSTRMASWSAGYYASSDCPAPARFRGNPTSKPAGREWFRDLHWRPYLKQLRALLETVGLETLEMRARDVLTGLALRKLDFEKTLLPHGLITALNDRRPLPRPAGRRKKTPLMRAHEYADAIRQADARPGAVPGTWFPLRILEGYGMKRPRANWTPEVRREVKKLAIQIRQKGGRRTWEVRLTCR